MGAAFCNQRLISQHPHACSPSHAQVMYCRCCCLKNLSQHKVTKSMITSFDSTKCQLRNQQFCTSYLAAEMLSAHFAWPSPARPGSQSWNCSHVFISVKTTCVWDQGAGCLCKEPYQKQRMSDFACLCVSDVVALTRATETTCQYKIALLVL